MKYWYLFWQKLKLGICTTSIYLRQKTYIRHELLYGNLKVSILKIYINLANPRSLRKTK